MIPSQRCTELSGPLRAAALCVVLVAAVLAAGCLGSNEKFVQEQDIEIIKIDSDGAITWNTIIDYGNDEEMTDIIQMDDGSFVIAGGSSPKNHCNDYGRSDPLWYVPEPTVSQLIGLSGTGKILWLRNYSPGWNTGIISILKNPDGSLEAISRNGEFWHLNPDGSIIANRSMNISRITSAAKTHDGGYVIVSDHYMSDISGSNITRLNQSGMQEWSFWLNESRYNQISPVIELPNQNEFLFGASFFDTDISGSRIVIGKFSPDGLQVRETSLSDTTGYNPSILPVDDGYILRADHDLCTCNLSKTTILAKLDHDGTLKSFTSHDSGSEEFFNTYIEYIEIIPTKDSGYISIVFPAVNPTMNDIVKHIAIKKVDANGTIQWNSTLTRDVNFAGKVKKVTQTSDGGYAIMLATKKMSKC